MPANMKVLVDEEAELRTRPISLDHAQRKVVEAAIREACEYRRYSLRAVNARTNHVHTVVSAACKPEHAMSTFKAYATRQLRDAHVFARDVRPWARHGSTRYLWTEEEVTRAIEYVMFGQGDEPFR